MGARSANRKALSLLELLVAVVILAIGIAYVLRSFWGTITAIEVVENRVAAIQLLDSELNRIEAAVAAGEYPVVGSRGEEFDLGTRSAVYKEDIEEFVPDWLPEPEEEEEEDEKTNIVRSSPSIRLLRVTSSLTWQEGGYERGQSMSMILSVPVEEDVN
jgi:prepilin-type N-terminal cleavage/methylation domain-containing protein